MTARRDHVREDGRRAAEHAVLEGDAVVDRDVVLDLHAVADDDAGGDEHVLGEHAVAADPGAGHDVARSARCACRRRSRRRDRPAPSRAPDSRHRPPLPLHRLVEDAGGDAIEDLGELAGQPPSLVAGDRLRIARGRHAAVAAPRGRASLPAPSRPPPPSPRCARHRSTPSSDASGALRRGDGQDRPAGVEVLEHLGRHVAVVGRIRRPERDERRRPPLRVERGGARHRAGEAERGRQRAASAAAARRATSRCRPTNHTSSAAIGRSPRPTMASRAANRMPRIARAVGQRAGVDQREAIGGDGQRIDRRPRRDRRDRSRSARPTPARPSRRRRLAAIGSDTVTTCAARASVCRSRRASTPASGQVRRHADRCDHGSR